MNTVFIVAIIIGILLICFFIFTQFQKSKCTTKITGKFLKVNKYTGYGNGISVTYYSPVFQYSFNNNFFEKQSFQSFSKKYIEKKFVSGKNYDIYINENNPKCFIVDKKIPVSDLLIILLGVCFIIMGFLAYLV